MVYITLPKLGENNCDLLFLTPLLEAPKHELEFPSEQKKTQTLSHPQRLTSNLGAKVPCDLD